MAYLVEGEDVIVHRCGRCHHEAEAIVGRTPITKPGRDLGSVSRGGPG